MKKSVCELFAGVGGFRLGIEASGIKAEPVYTNEIDDNCEKTYKQNFGIEPDDDITQVEVVQSWETPFITSDAVAKITADIAEKDTPDVDVYAGASVTCVAICNAVRNALEG